METIRKIRLARHRDKRPIREIARKFNLSRNTVKKVLLSDETAFSYERKRQPRPKLGPFIETLTERLQKDSSLPRKQQRTAQILFEELQRDGYQGGYDSVRRFVQSWRREQSGRRPQAFIPLSFEPGEAFQFDWSHEKVELGGMPALVKVAHFRLCHSRMPFVVAFPRESLEMVLDAHAQAFEFFGGVCRRGIYDNLKTAVDKVLLGKARVFNRRFLQLCSHYLFEPVACTPAAGWEKGQVENQVKTIRRRFFTPLPKFATLADLNDWLRQQCLAYARTQRHPEHAGQSVWEAFEREQSHLLQRSRPFDGYAESMARVSTVSLVNFDRNRYSVDCREIGQAVQVRSYAQQVVIVSNGRVIGVHPRQFGRDRTIYDPWHYLPALEKKPGALRNGAPFKGWELPEPVCQVRKKLQGRPDGDRQFVDILAAVRHYGLEAVERVCSQALAERTVSRDVILNLLSRHQQEPGAAEVLPPQHLRLKVVPLSDCARYDRLLSEVTDAAV